ncbi:S8 family serine peptidase [Dactylosporangium aurantiacum]|uniref:S8 family serine peptidase n=1 Tax=Dactylosporangium aurantiacum TaxID=35754 RepID=A0A9Q9IFD5_9ACTN|nr:S8 family peptidase [Dactylosporangium aurantiacum]MDG6107450.1 S8 family peptidase [Dactylosporangium aurantiacum]UWZ54426.1 S8 family serine peptidase [Dactylosporangium aurantiacum]
MGRILLVFTLAASYVLGAPVAARARTDTALYIVQLAGDPAGRQESARGRIRADRAAVLRRAGIGRTVAVYESAFNGFAAALTPAQKARVERTPGVRRVWRNERRTVDTISTPDFLGLTGDTGAWSRQFGDPSRAGEGMIIGVVDTGFWPESPSLAALPEPRPDQALIDRKWNAGGADKCDEGTGTAEQRITCNNKVIGARYYDGSGFGGWESEFRSPRDYDGHGTHTATTAAGLHDIPATINGDPVGHVSGMAPAARIAVYKALWRQSDGEGSGGTVDLLDAVDDAVSDGVDVINYSVSGSSALVVDPIELAFYNAAAAGVFVATSAGNSGPDASTVAHNAPWVTTVAASTHDRGADKSVTLGNGTTYTGAGQGPAVPSAPLVDAVTAGLKSADPDKVELCYPGTLDPAAVKGRIVLCKRGVNPRTDKSIAVRDAGGVGMVLYNPDENSLNADYHVIPTVHVDHVAGAAIKAYAKTAAPTASLSAVSKTVPRAPAMAAFSSPGPALAGGGDLIKPDITAPGVDIVAGVSPAGHHGNLYDGESGTSMSSPHVAGIAALVRAAHPTWTPSAVQSALMTTASVFDNTDGMIQRAGSIASPLDYGAGHVTPARAFDPGLVYESGPQDWARYACGLGQLQLVSDWCPTVGTIDPSDLNYPSIAVAALPGRQTVTRTVTNVSTQPSVYVAAVTQPQGVTVTVSPSTLTVGAGESATFQVTITRTDAPYRTWTFGSLTWTDLRGHTVRSPIGARPVALAGPGEVTGTGAAGTATIDLTGGYTGTITTKIHGLAPSTVTERRLAGSTAAFVPTAPATGPAVFTFSVTVPPGTEVARLATFAADHVPGTDLDLYVYQDGDLVDRSDGTTADEEVALTSTGVFEVYVVRFAAPPDADALPVRAHTFLVGGAAAGNLTVTPRVSPVRPQQVVSFEAAWKGLDPAKRYLGMVEFGDGTEARAWTTVAIGPVAGPPPMPVPAPGAPSPAPSASASSAPSPSVSGVSPVPVPTVSPAAGGAGSPAAGGR